MIEEDVPPTEAKLEPDKRWAKVTLLSPRAAFNDQYILRATNTEFPSLVATATFRAGYSVSTKVQGEGFLDPAMPTVVEAGKTLRIRVMPQAGNKLNSVEAPDCPGSLVTEGDATYYVTGPLTKNCVVTATFERVASTNPVVLNATEFTVSPPTAVVSEKEITFTAKVSNTGSDAFSGYLAVAIEKDGVWKLVKSQSVSGSPLGKGIAERTYTFTGDPDLPAGEYKAQLFYALVPPADVNNVMSAGWVRFPNATTPVTILAPPAVVKISAPNLVAPVSTPLTLTATVTGTRHPEVKWSEPTGMVNFSAYDKASVQVKAPATGKYTITATSVANPNSKDTIEFIVGTVNLSGTLPEAPVTARSEQGELTVTATVKNVSEYPLPFGGLVAVGMDVNGDGSYWAPIGVARFNTAEHPLLAHNAQTELIFKKTIMSKPGNYKLKLFFNELQTADVNNLKGWKAIADGQAKIEAPDVAISVTPPFESAPTDGLKTFTATVTGSQNTGVNWTADQPGVTFLPDNKANPVQVKALLPMTYTITATSDVNPKASASAQFKVGSVVLKATDPEIAPNPAKLGDTITVKTQLTNENAALSSPFTGWVTAAIKWTADRVDEKGNKIPGAWQTLGVQRFGGNAATTPPSLPVLQQGQTVPLTFTGLAGVAAGTYDIQLFYAEQQPADEGNALST